MKISVLIPVYHKENPLFFDKALSSILEFQTVKPGEVVVVEDGPLPREIEQVLDKHQAQYPQIVNRHKLSKNEGMGFAMNVGLHAASGDWIARMDSDDVAHPERFSKQIEFLKENDSVDVLGSAIREFNKEPGDIKSYRRLPDSHSKIVNYMKFRCPFNHMTVMYRKELAIKAGGYWSHRHLEDYNLWYEMFKQGAIFHNLTEPLVDVRIGNQMISRRTGYHYFEHEKLFLKKLKAECFITPIEYRFLSTLKMCTRLMPPMVLSLVYKWLLRRSY